MRFLCDYFSDLLTCCIIRRYGKYLGVECRLNSLSGNIKVEVSFPLICEVK